MNAIRNNRLSLIFLATVGTIAIAAGCSSENTGSGTGGTTGSGGRGTGGSTGELGGRGMGGAPGTGGAVVDAGTGTGGRGTGGTATDAGTGTGGTATDAGTGTGGRGTGGTATDGGTGTGGRGTGGTATDGGTGTGGRGTGGSATDGGSSDGGATMTLTSTAFTDGARFPAANTCTGGSHQSPQLAWTGAPAGTMSYAILLTDTTNGFRHWVIWDIPAATTMLAANLAKTATLTDPAGAKEANRFGSNGYFGPCPSGTDHIYQFEVTALDVATLSVGGTVPTTPAGVDTVRAQIAAHALAHGDLSGVSNASM